MRVGRRQGGGKQEADGDQDEEEEETGSGRSGSGDVMSELSELVTERRVGAVEVVKVRD
jgi:hypothetical protein